MASTGSIRDAPIAGIIPEMIPIITDKLTPKMILNIEMLISKCTSLPIKVRTSQASIIPASPPTIHKTIASSRNSNKI